MQPTCTPCIYLLRPQWFLFFLFFSEPSSLLAASRVSPLLHTACCVQFPSSVEPFRKPSPCQSPTLPQSQHQGCRTLQRIFYTWQNCQQQSPVLVTELEGFTVKCAQEDRRSWLLTSTRAGREAKGSCRGHTVIRGEGADLSLPGSYPGATGN